MIKKILTLNALRNQHLIVPLADVNRIVKDAIGIQVQYMNNALFAISVRCNSVLSKLDASDICKIWSFRGTLHLHDSADIISIRMILKDEWFSRWGKYMNLYFPYDIRKYMQNKTCELISSGICDRQSLREEFVHLGFEMNMVQHAFSSWGGILKDLNYQNRIHFLEFDKKYFSLSREIMLEDMDFSFGSKLVKRYYSFYGPATLADFCYWAGIPQSLGMKWQLSGERDFSHLLIENKKYYYVDMIDERIDKIPKCIFLSGFDPFMLAYRDKSRWLKAEHHDMIFKKNGFIHNIVLLNGVAGATWRIDNNNLLVKLFESSKKNQQIIKDFVESNKLLSCKHVTYV